MYTTVNNTTIIKTYIKMHDWRRNEHKSEHNVITIIFNKLNNKSQIPEIINRVLRIKT